MEVNGEKHYGSVRVATAQFYSHTDVPGSLELCRKHVHEAAAVMAQLIVLPENANRCRSDYSNRQVACELYEELDGDFVTSRCDTARELKIMVIASVDLKTSVAP